MAEITDQMLEDFKTALNNGDHAFKFIRDNDLMGKVNNKDLRDAFSNKYGEDEFRNIMFNSRIKSLGRNISKMAERLQSIEDCDSLTSDLNDAIDSISIKKAQLESEN